MLKKNLFVKLFLIIIGVVIVLGGIAASVAMKFASPQDLSTAVRLQTATRGDLVEIVSAPGQIQPKTKVSISARIAARILELPHKAGEAVTKGNPNATPPVPASVLVRLDSKDLEAQLRAAEARYAAQKSQIEVSQARISAQQKQIVATQVQLADAQRDLKRQKELLDSKDVSQSAVDQAQARVDQLQAQLDSSLQSLEADRTSLMVLRHQLDAADAEIARARDNLSYTTIVSPIDGTVTRLNAEVGELVVTGTMNNAGTVIMEVADLSQMLVNARVDESAVAQVQPGQKVVVRAQAYADREFEGVVQTVALSQTDERDGSRYYKTEILIDSAGQRIYSGLTADVDIETRHHQNVLKVPSQAVLGRPVDDLPSELRDRPEVDKNKTLATVVYRCIDGKAVVTPVKIGPSDVTDTIIESGISDGDMIIIGPYKVLESIKHDQAVKDERATTQPTTQAADQP